MLGRTSEPELKRTEAKRKDQYLEGANDDVRVREKFDYGLLGNAMQCDVTSWQVGSRVDCP